MYVISTRYLYSCVWKNVGVLNDDFFGAFLAAANSILAALYAAVLVVTRVRQQKNATPT